MDFSWVDDIEFGTDDTIHKVYRKFIEEKRKELKMETLEWTNGDEVLYEGIGDQKKGVVVGNDVEMEKIIIRTTYGDYVGAFEEDLTKLKSKSELESGDSFKIKGQLYEVLAKIYDHSVGEYVYFARRIADGLFTVKHEVKIDEVV